MSFTGDGKVTEGLRSRLLTNVQVGLQKGQHLSIAFSSHLAQLQVQHVSCCFVLQFYASQCSLTRHLDYGQMCPSLDLF